MNTSNHFDKFKDPNSDSRNDSFREEEEKLQCKTPSNYLQCSFLSDNSFPIDKAHTDYGFGTYASSLNAKIQF